MPTNQKLGIVITARDASKRAFASLRRSVGAVGRAFKSTTGLVTGFLAVVGGVPFVAAVIATNREFQSLKATLVTFTGSVGAAEKAFQKLSDFASKTPFSLAELTAAFNRMLSVGLKPTITALDAFGNVAAGSGKSIIQFVEAVADATVGEFERLKEFGIKAASEGKKVSVTFKGLTTTIGKNAEEIQAFLTNLGRTEFAGAMTRQAATLNGAFSNLGDSFDSFFSKIGNAGFNKSLADTTRRFSDMVGKSDDLAEAFSGLLVIGLKVVNVFFDIADAAVSALRKLSNSNAFESLATGMGKFVVSSAQFLGIADDIEVKFKAWASATKATAANLAIVQRSIKGDFERSPSDIINPAKLPPSKADTDDIGFDALEDQFEKMRSGMKSVEETAVTTASRVQNVFVQAFDGIRLTGEKDIDALISKLLQLAAQEFFSGDQLGALGGFAGAGAPGGGFGGGLPVKSR